MKTATSRIVIGVIIGLAVVLAVVFAFLTGINRENGKGLGKAFEYDLSEFRKTDPALVRYKETGIIETGFQKVFAVASMAKDSKDRIYVAGDSSVRVFNDRGVVLSEIRLSDTSRCLTVTSDESMYAGLRDHVEIYSSSGSLKARWDSLGQNALLTSIVAYEDNVFVADAGNRVVLRYDTAGNLLNRIGERDERKSIQGLVVPTPYLDIAVGPDGLLRVANPGLQRIEAYTFDGYMEFSWGQPSMGIEGFGGCSNPANFAIFTDGKYVTCEKGLPRVKIYNANGVFESVVAGAEQFAISEKFLITGREEDDQVPGLDVALGSGGRIFVLDPDKKVVRIFMEQ